MGVRFLVAFDVDFAGIIELHLAGNCSTSFSLELAGHHIDIHCERCEASWYVLAPPVPPPSINQAVAPDSLDCDPKFSYLTWVTLRMLVMLATGMVIQTFGDEDVYMIIFVVAIKRNTKS